MSFLPQALSEYKGLRWRIEEEEIYDNIIMIEGTKPPESEINTKIAKLEAEYDAQEYARNRKVEYDALNQFELISDDSINSTTTHKDAIAAIKTKWPKDNSGPVE